MSQSINGIFAQMAKSREVSALNEEAEKTQAAPETVEESGKETVNEEQVEKQDQMNETAGLDVQKKAVNGKTFTVEINGNKYSYTPLATSGLSAKELKDKFDAIAKHNVGRALGWLKKNATTNDSYSKRANEDCDDVDEVKKTVVRDGVVQKVNKKKPGTHATSAQKAALRKARKKAHTAAANKARNKSLKKGRARGLYEEIDEIELQARLEEVGASDYMMKALDEGKYDLVQRYLELNEED